MLIVRNNYSWELSCTDMGVVHQQISSPDQGWYIFRLYTTVLLGAMVVDFRHFRTVQVEEVKQGQKQLPVQRTSALSLWDSVCIATCSTNLHCQRMSSLRVKMACVEYSLFSIWFCLVDFINHTVRLYPSLLLKLLMLKQFVLVLKQNIPPAPNLWPSLFYLLEGI